LTARDTESVLHSSRVVAAVEKKLSMESFLIDIGLQSDPSNGLSAHEDKEDWLVRA
jgi:hypothetical protein